MDRRKTIIALLAAATLIIASTACLGTGTDATLESQLLQVSAENDQLTTQAEAAQAEINDLITERDLLIDEAKRLTAEAEAAQLQMTKLSAERDLAISKAETIAEERTLLETTIADTRAETRWVPTQWTDNKGFPQRDMMSISVTNAGSESDNSVLGLRASCSNEDHFLYLWAPGTWDDGIDYVVDVSLDGKRPRGEILWGYGTSFAGFESLDGGHLWDSESITVAWSSDPPEVATFDTAQLLRMFPTEASFCTGQPPAGD